jgi:hypothetical protein
LKANIGPCHVSGIFLPLRVKSLPLATNYEVKIPLRKWKKSLLQRNPAQMTSAIVSCKNRLKTRVALLEPLDLSGIAVGNVGVPTC